MTIGTPYYPPTNEYKQFRVWAAAFPEEAIHNWLSVRFWPVDTVDEAIWVIKGLAELDLLSSRVITNGFGLEEHDLDGNWGEWHDKDGDDIITKLNRELEEAT